MHNSVTNLETSISKDKQKLKKLIRMCMNEEYLKASNEEKEKNLKRNKATFKKDQDKDHKTEE